MPCVVMLNVVLLSVIAPVHFAIVSHFHQLGLALAYYRHQTLQIRMVLKYMWLYKIINKLFLELGSFVVAISEKRTIFFIQTK